MADGRLQREFGVIKSYLPLRGFGFIRREKGKDVFFLRTDAESEAELFEGNRVSFIVFNDERGPRAKAVVREG